MANENTIVKRHDDDVIFSSESLREFIRLIQRQGINNLDIYSVQKDLLSKNSQGNYLYTAIHTRDASNTNLEFNYNELEKRRSYFVIVRHSLLWQKDNVDSEINVRTGRHQFVKTGNTISFNKVIGSFTNDTNEIQTIGTNATNAKHGTVGTFTTLIDDMQETVQIFGFDNDGKYTGSFNPNQGTDKFLRGDGSWTNAISNHFLPTANNTYDLGSNGNKWRNIYISGKLNGTATTADYSTTAGWAIKAAQDEDGNQIIASYGASLTYSGSTLSLSSKNGTVLSQCTITTTDNKTSSSNSNSKLYLIGATTQTTNGVSTYSNSNVYTQSGYLYATRVYNAVFNDYAECRKTIDLEPGKVVKDNDDGSLSCSNARLIPGCHIISDTYGHLMGETDEYKTPIAVAGRVLVYPYQSRENYHAGMSVCAAPNGTVDIMTREEIINYPDCIIGTVSEIPDYEIWGTDNVKVNGRIWIYVK